MWLPFRGGKTPAPRRDVNALTPSRSDMRKKGAPANGNGAHLSDLCLTRAYHSWIGYGGLPQDRTTAGLDHAPTTLFFVTHDTRLHVNIGKEMAV